MALRTITWTVDENLRITPQAVQDAGIQGEHNATEVAFALPEELTSETHQYYIEYVGGDGMYDVTGAIDSSNGKVSFLLPRAWTQGGGVATLRLIVEDQGSVAYSVEVRIRYRDRQPETEAERSLLEGTVRDAVVAAETAATEANNKANAAKGDAAAAEAAADKAEDAKTILETAAAEASSAAETATTAATTATTAATTAQQSAAELESVRNKVANLEKTQKQLIDDGEKAVEECNNATEEMRLAYDDVVRGGHIENLKEQNTGGVFSVWVGDMEQYGELTEKEPNRLYVVTHDMPGEGFESDVAKNAEDIAKNASDIAKNASDIAKNTEDIAKNTSDIAKSAEDIAKNAGDIAKNASDIAKNAEDIDNNTSAIASHETSIQNISNNINNRPYSGTIVFEGAVSQSGHIIKEIPIGGRQRGTVLICTSYTVNDITTPTYSVHLFAYDVTKEATGTPDKRFMVARIFESGTTDERTTYTWLNEAGTVINVSVLGGYSGATCWWIGLV